jgi:pimeloyl-ACP methyl ester carboxylesterase
VRCLSAVLLLLLACESACLAGGLSPILPVTETTPAVATELRVGKLTLHRCDTAAPWCGVIARPLDPAGAIPGTIPVYFEYYPRTGPHTGAGPSSDTIVATEGGPGFPATESRDEYLTLLQPLRSGHDVLIMDNRGTGRSGAIDCKALQNAAALTDVDIGACGRSLGSAAPLYSTALAADDLAALLDALSIRRINLYGDSYGTYFAQVFALRHPERLRSLVLDGAYPLEGPDYGWYPHYAPAMRAKFNLACERDPVCGKIPGNSIDHIGPTLALLRAKPFSASTRYGHEQSTAFTADATSLAVVMFGGSPAYATVRELDAAARAFNDGDRPPLLRLMAETLTSVDSRDPTHSPLQFSAGLAAAVSCQDPPQIVDMNLAPEKRVPERDLEIRKRKNQAPDTYAPFTIDEYRRMPLDYAFIDECVRWPASPGGVSLPLVSGRYTYPNVPVLVISGELDNMTSVADGTAAAAHYPDARHVVIANSFHVNALPHARSQCGAILVRRFMENLRIGDDNCAAAVPAVRLVPRFARHVEELEAARPVAGNASSGYELRAVTAALLTSEDVVVRADEDGAGKGIGLRGGSFLAQAVSTGYRLQLRNVRWVEDLSVSGVIDWRGRNGVANAALELQSANGAAGKLQLQWREGASGALATAHGELGGKAVVAEAPAP